MKRYPESLLGMIVFVCTTALVAASTSAEDPPKLFPDAGLEAAVRAEVFEKRYNTEPLTKADVEKISQVVGRGKKIKNLEGLQHCPAVMLIDLKDNEIVDLKPLAELKRLQSVTLAGNKIKDIQPLKGLTAMQLLDLSGNEVSDLAPLEAMSNLRTLYVANNKLETVQPIAKLTKIWSLDASGNKLTDLSPVADLKWLTTLDVRNNQIKQLDPIANLPALKYLLISKNKIEDLAPLVKMCEADAKTAKRFAPYLNVYVGENPLNEEGKAKAFEALKAAGVKVVEK
ncbi:Internalin-A precursor [Roseimaritima multifibrata]|uniref:Internalin-A n=1 Tax=Roseimaritima multifibrata TaxID=1930274 RepID=A0A517M917_9BACT|nr:leucine-rich repeat domain-containing protein [Roseimaritima multifibrata]QDS91382.1 Internalin-A precursor [Roseimaritima multifibrata]